MIVDSWEMYQIVWSLQWGAGGVYCLDLSSSDSHIHPALSRLTSLHCSSSADKDWVQNSERGTLASYTSHINIISGEIIFLIHNILSMISYQMIK